MGKRSPELSPRSPGDPEPSRSPEGEEKRPEPRFALGQTLATPGALEALAAAEQDSSELLTRHVTGDWGDLEEEDQEENEFSVKRGFRILSAYKLEQTGQRVWIITEADRSATTILLPQEY